MSKKSVAFGKKPGADKANQAAAMEAFVKSGKAADEPTKRVSVDMPASMYQAFKVKCAMNGDKMTEVLRARIDEYTKA